MPYVYFNMEKRNVKNFPTDQRYIVMLEPSEPMPEKGKKRISKEQKEKYIDEVNKHNMCMAAMESGHVNLHSRNGIVTDNLNSFAINALLHGFGRKRIFYIEPIQSREFNSYGKYEVSEFDVVKEFKSPDELLKKIVEDCDYDQLLDKILQNYYKGKEEVALLLKKLNELTGTVIYLEDLITPYWDYSYSQESRVIGCDNSSLLHDFVKELLDGNIIKLYKEQYFTCLNKYVERLLRLHWYDFALEVMQNFKDDDGEILGIRKNKYIKKLLENGVDNSCIDEMIKTINIDGLSAITLTVTDFSEDNYGQKSEKIFYNVGKVRSYLVTEYDVPFEMAAGDIDNMCWKDYVFNIKIDV